MNATYTAHEPEYRAAMGRLLARSSRVNPALTIHAWGLRLGEHPAGEIQP